MNVMLKDAETNTQINQSPTLKQLFSRETLVSYIEAARHKTLFEEVKE
jgi:hypothetical protein